MNMSLDFLLDPSDIFGGQASKRAVESQENQNAAEQALRLRLAEEARDDIFKLFPAAEESRNLGFQGALDVFGQTIPQQLGALQQGNVQAQEALIGGLPQFQNAILGQQVDFSQFQPQQVDFSTDFAQQTLPEFTKTEDALLLEGSDALAAKNAAAQKNLPRPGGFPRQGGGPGDVRRGGGGSKGRVANRLR